MASREVRVRNVGAPPSVIVEGPWGDDDQTTVSPMMEFTDRAGVIDMDADTVLDDRSIDEILLAVGTNETRSRGQPAFMTSPDSSPPITSAAPPPPVSAPPPRAARARSVPPRAAPVSHPPAVPYNPAPVAYNTGPYESGPVPYQTGPVTYQTGPIPYQTGPIPYQTGPIPYQTGPVAYQTGPFPYQVVAQPVPVAASRAQPRSPLQILVPLLALGLILFAAAAVGRYVFARDSGAPQRSAATTAATPTTAPAAPAPAASAPAATAPATAPSTPAPAPPATAATAAAAAPTAQPIRLPVASLADAAEALASSPVQGQVSHAYLTKEREVAKGEKLFEIVQRTRGAANARQLAAEVKKLERLAADEPEYQPFLDKARRDYQQARGRSETTLVRSPRAGLAAPRVARGAQVKEGELLATTGERGTWIARAAVGAERPGVDWTCALVPADGDAARATCVIEKLVDSRDGAEVVARVKADDVAWLRAAGSKHLLLQPPAPR